MFIRLPKNSGQHNDQYILTTYVLTVGDIKKALAKELNITTPITLLGPKFNVLDDDSALKGSLGLTMTNYLTAMY